ncbi:MAG TPA: TIGR03086 family metal-binding protein [Acidimicrobiales bacterium]
MTTQVDFGPVARRLGEVAAAVPDSALGDPTPCEGYTVGDLVEHVGTLAQAFAAAAAKDASGIGDRRPTGDASQLPADWRTAVPAHLDALADAWREPAAWTGFTRVGGVDLPGEMAGVIALDELVLHGWDLARATDQAFEPDPAALEVVHGFLADLATPEMAAIREGRFGPVVEVAEDRPLLDRVVGLAGRDPDWSPGSPG